MSQEDERGDSARAVGEAFLANFYRVASKNSPNLHKFYAKDVARITHDGRVIVGVPAIRVAAAEFADAEFDLAPAALDFQPTIADGVLVSVQGALVQLKTGGKPRSFSHVFVLARDVSDRTKFFVQNEVLRYPTRAPRPSAEGAASTEKKLARTAPAQPPVEPTPATSSSAAVNPGKEDSAPSPSPPPAGGGGSSWASIAAKATASSAGPAPAAAPHASTATTNDSNNGASTSAPSAGFPPPSPTEEGAKPLAAKPARAKPIDGCSLFVKNADPAQGVLADRLEKHFASFGNLASVEVNTSKKFAFINFTQRASVLAVLATRPQLVNGVILEIEERHTAGARSSHPSAAAGTSSSTPSSSRAAAESSDASSGSKPQRRQRGTGTAKAKGEPSASASSTPPKPHDPSPYTT